MKKLPTMTAFVMQIQENLHKYWDATDEIYDTDRAWQETLKYAELLQTPLKLGQFILCNSKGEPMGRLPARHPRFKDKPPSKITEEYRDNYKKALDKVLFKGWKWRKYSDTASMYDLMNSQMKVIATKNRGKINIHYEGKTIESLIDANFELEPTEACKNQIGI